MYVTLYMHKPRQTCELYTLYNCRPSCSVQECASPKANDACPHISDFPPYLTNFRASFGVCKNFPNDHFFLLFSLYRPKFPMSLLPPVSEKLHSPLFLYISLIFVQFTYFCIILVFSLLPLF